MTDFPLKIIKYKLHIVNIGIPFERGREEGRVQFESIGTGQSRFGG